MAERRECPFFVDDARPFAQRTDGMSLDIVRPNDIPRGKIPFIKDEDRSLKTQDIERAQSHYPHLNYLQKPDYSVGSTDPDHFGGRARSYYAPMDRRPRDLSLTTADIEYAQAKASKFKGNRHTDPVCPNYELPSTNLRPLTPPRWNGRHLHDISDIEKSSSKIRIPTRNYVRDPNDASDIEFASANYQERVQRRTRTGKADITMNVKDINQTKPLHYAPRCTNPLEPEYKVSTTATTSLHTTYTEEKGRRDVQLHRSEAEIHGFVQGSKPRKLQWDNGEPQFSLVREDIAGTVPQRWIGAVPVNIYDPPEVKPVITFHDPHDIPGAQVGTLKKGIEGSRRAGQTNPLNPRYKMLDGDVRPQPVPVFDAERNIPTHSLMQSRAQASSLPNLQRYQGATPVGSVPQSQRSNGGMRRDASDGMLRQRDSPAASQRGAFLQQPGGRAGTPSGMQQPGLRRAPSVPDTPAGRAMPTRAGPGTPAMRATPQVSQRGPSGSGRGTPSGYAMPPGYTMPPVNMPPSQYGPERDYDYAMPSGGNYGPPGGVIYGPSGETYGQQAPGGGQQYYEEEYRGPPQESYGGPPQESYGGPRQESYGGPRQESYGGPPQGVTLNLPQESPGGQYEMQPGDYGDGYIPEGYVHD